MIALPVHPGAAANRRSSGGARLLLYTMVVVVLVGLITSGVVYALVGSDAAIGTLIGVGLACGVFGFGTFVVDTVSNLQPGASLLIALTTYALQLGVVLVVLLALERAPAADVAWSKAWLGGALIGATMVWIGTQVAMHMTARVPAFETTDVDHSSPASRESDGGAR